MQTPPFIPPGCNSCAMFFIGHYLFDCGSCRGKAVATWVPYICGVGYLRPTPAGVVQRRLLFVVVVQATCVVLLLFLFEHFGAVQCPTLSCSRCGPQHDRLPQMSCGPLPGSNWAQNLQTVRAWIVSGCQGSHRLQALLKEHLSKRTGTEFVQSVSCKHRSRNSNRKL